MHCFTVMTVNIWLLHARARTQAHACIALQLSPWAYTYSNQHIHTWSPANDSEHTDLIVATAKTRWIQNLQAETGNTTGGSCTPRAKHIHKQDVCLPDSAPACWDAALKKSMKSNIRSSRLASGCFNCNKVSAHTWQELIEEHTHTHTHTLTNMHCFAAITVSMSLYTNKKHIFLTKIKMTHLIQIKHTLRHMHASPCSNHRDHDLICLEMKWAYTLFMHTALGTHTPWSAYSSIRAGMIAPRRAYTCRHDRAYVCTECRHDGAYVCIECRHDNTYVCIYAQAWSR